MEGRQQWVPAEAALDTDLRLLRRLLDEAVPKLMRVPKLAKVASILFPARQGLDAVLAAVKLAIDRMPRDAWSEIAERLYGLTAETLGESLAFRRHCAYARFCEAHDRSEEPPGEEAFRTNEEPEIVAALTSLLIELVEEAYAASPTAPTEVEIPAPAEWEPAPLPSLLPDAIADAARLHPDEEADEAGPLDRVPAVQPPALAAPVISVGRGRARSKRALRTLVVGVGATLILASGALALWRTNLLGQNGARTPAVFASHHQAANTGAAGQPGLMREAPAIAMKQGPRSKKSRGGAGPVEAVATAAGTQPASQSTGTGCACAGTASYRTESTPIESAPGGEEGYGAEAPSATEGSEPSSESATSEPPASTQVTSSSSSSSVVVVGNGTASSSTEVSATSESESSVSGR